MNLESDECGEPYPLPLPPCREISIFNPNFGGLTRSDTKFANLSKFDIVRAKCFETRVFHLFSIFPLFPLIFAFPSQPKKTYLPFALESIKRDRSHHSPYFRLQILQPCFFKWTDVVFPQKILTAYGHNFLI